MRVVVRRRPARWVAGQWPATRRPHLPPANCLGAGARSTRATPRDRGEKSMAPRLLWPGDVDLERMLKRCLAEQWSITDLREDGPVPPMSREKEMAIVQCFTDMAGIERL